MMELPTDVNSIFLISLALLLTFVFVALYGYRSLVRLYIPTPLFHFSSFSGWWKVKEPVPKAPTEVEKLSLLVKELEAARELLEAQQLKLEETLLLVEKDNYRKTEELLEAQQLQLAMLPQNTPFLPGYEFSFYSLPASEVGGDYYDYHFSKGNRKLHLVLGDATGHGFKPGILVATAKSYFKTLAGKVDNEQILNHISGAIKSLNARGLYMGLTLLDIEGDRVSVVSSGMPPLFVYNHERGEVKQHRLKGIFLGIKQKLPLHRKVFRLKKGDVLLLMTDGLAETQNADGEMLGYESISEKLRNIADRSSAEIIDYLVWMGATWSEEGRQRDDVSMIALRKK